MKLTLSFSLFSQESVGTRKDIFPEKNEGKGNFLLRRENVEYILEGEEEEEKKIYFSWDSVAIKYALKTGHWARARQRKDIRWPAAIEYGEISGFMPAIRH